MNTKKPIMLSLLKVIPLSGEMSRSDKRVMGPLAVGGLKKYRPAKRIVSLILSFAMLFSITAGIDLSAYATSKTQSDAVNWANAQVGKSLDQDGVYGAQCVDLIRYYYQFLGVSPVSGNGCDYAKNSLPSGWQRIKTYNGFVPQPGDIAVWTYASSSYGHVAIITSADSSRMNVVEQNGSTHITRSHSYSYSYGTFYGVIRPNFASGLAPNYAYISVDKLNYKIDETVNFIFNTDTTSNTNSLWVYCPDGSTLSYSNLGTTYQLAFGMAGYYEALVQVWNEYGNKCSSKISWYVGKPQYAYISIDKNTVKKNENIRFKFNTACKSNWNTLWIYCPDGTSKYYQYCGSEYSLSFEEIGEYSALVQAWNDIGECMSEKVYFKVVPNVCTHKYDNGILTKSPTCSSTGTKKYTCTICGATKTETIAKTSHSYSWKNSGGYVINSCNNCANEKLRLPFEDLYGYEYYGDYIAYTSVYNKFITGTNPPEKTLFSPTTPITRAMFVTILYRMAGEPYKNGTPYRTSPFTDITDTSVYYYDAACWALKNGITTETTFKPFENVNREQTASFLFRYAQKNGRLGNSAYKNVNLANYPDFGSVHGWAVEAMKWANFNGMITGTQQGYINPQGATQRIHATKILYGFGKVCNISNFA